MKAILVIDMPECCCACDYCNEFGICKYVGNVHDAFYRGLRYIKCPLKPMPEKKILDEELFMSGNFRLIQARFTGWNDCIDTITGETE